MDNYKKIIFSLLFFIPVLVFYFDDLVNYIIKILELDSDTRGIDSGGTGRVELWKMGINHISSNSFINSILGEGLRASSADVIGFSTESSYITIIIEHGLILGSLLIISIYFFVLVSFFNLKRKNNIHLVFFVFLFYACIQSIFNRYLIAIGNPFSIFLIILLFYYSKRFIFLAKSS